MSPDAQKILDEARQLPPDEREWLAECLLIEDESLAAAEVESAWDDEIKRRLDQIDSGGVKMISHEEFIADLDAHLSSKRKARNHSGFTLIPRPTPGKQLIGIGGVAELRLWILPMNSKQRLPTCGQLHKPACRIHMAHAASFSIGFHSLLSSASVRTTFRSSLLHTPSAAPVTGGNA
jgi:Putative addiction module component